jgi:hypothetical protein
VNRRVHRLIRTAIFALLLLIGAGVVLLVFSHVDPPGAKGYSIRGEHLHQWIPFVAAPYIFAALGLWCVPPRPVVFWLVAITAGLVALWGGVVLVQAAVAHDEMGSEPGAFIGTLIPFPCALLAFLGGFVGWLDSRYPREERDSGNGQEGEAFNTVEGESTSVSPLMLAIHRAAPWLCAVALLAALSFLGALCR